MLINIIMNRCDKIVAHLDSYILRSDDNETDEMENATYPNL